MFSGSSATQLLLEMQSKANAEKQKVSTSVSNAAVALTSLSQASATTSESTNTSPEKALNRTASQNLLNLIHSHSSSTLNQSVQIKSPNAKVVSKSRPILPAGSGSPVIVQPTSGLSGAKSIQLVPVHIIRNACPTQVGSKPPQIIFQVPSGSQVIAKPNITSAINQSQTTVPAVTLLENVAQVSTSASNAANAVTLLPQPVTILRSPPQQSQQNITFINPTNEQSSIATNVPVTGGVTVLRSVIQPQNIPIVVQSPDKRQMEFSGGPNAKRSRLDYEIHTSKNIDEKLNAISSITSEYGSDIPPTLTEDAPKQLNIVDETVDHFHYDCMELAVAVSQGFHDIFKDINIQVKGLKEGLTEKDIIKKEQADNLHQMENQDVSLYTEISIYSFITVFCVNLID